jgi:hypothetical protein
MNDCGISFSMPNPGVRFLLFFLYLLTYAKKTYSCVMCEQEEGEALEDGEEEEEEGEHSTDGELDDVSISFNNLVQSCTAWVQKPGGR